MKTIHIKYQQHRAAALNELLANKYKGKIEIIWGNRVSPVRRDEFYQLDAEKQGLFIKVLEVYPASENFFAKTILETTKMPLFKRLFNKRN